MPEILRERLQWKSRRQRRGIETESAVLSKGAGPSEEHA